MGDKKDKTVGDVIKDIKLDDLQKYVLGTKKNGSPRALYDIILDITDNDGSDRNDKNKKKNRNDIYIGIKNGGKKKKKKKKGKKNKYVHYNDISKL